MDYSLISSEVYKLLYFIPFIILIGIFKSRWFKGRFGEWLVNRSIQKNFDSDIYQLIKDVTLPTNSGSTQIDHILVSPYGVFVIETKNMKGWIYGSYKRAKWTVTNYGNKYQFLNPVKQNFKHLKVLQSLLELDNHQVYSLVVFVGNSKFKTPMPNNVFQGGKYRNFIESKTDIVLSEDEVSEIINKIDENRFERSFKTNREHIRYVKSKRSRSD